jgi:hypothetical protein
MRSEQATIPKRAKSRRAAPENLFSLHTVVNYSATISPESFAVHYFIACEGNML